MHGILDLATRRRDGVVGGSVLCRDGGAVQTEEFIDGGVTWALLHRSGS